MKKIIIILLITIAVYNIANANKNNAEIKLISYNIRLSSVADIDGENKWDNRKPATINMIEKEAPSVFGLQEALLEQVEYIETNLPQYGRIGLGRDDGKNSGEFMAIFYLSDKFNLLQSGTFWLSETPDTASKGWDAAYPRIVTWVFLQDIESKKEFYFFNTHFDHIGVEARKNSVKLAVEKIKEIAGENANIIFSGDLNIDISVPILEPLKQYMNVARECSKVTDSRSTFNGFGTVSDSIVIDHIFCKNVRCKTFRTLDGDYGVPYISDHYPIEFVFELR